MRTTLNETKIKKTETAIRAINNTLTKGRLNSVSRKLLKLNIRQYKDKITQLKERMKQVKQIYEDENEIKKLRTTKANLLSDLAYCFVRIKKIEKKLDELKDFLKNAQRT